MVGTATLATLETYLASVGIDSPAATRPHTTESSTDMSASNAPAGAPRTRREHRQARTTAERRLSTAQRELNQLQREVQRDLRTIRRHGETAAIVSRAELGVRGIARLVAGLRAGRTAGGFTRIRRPRVRPGHHPRPDARRPPARLRRLPAARQ
ncbi:MAG: hypothetical protein ACRDP6_22450 [Actinoallomurus sp.]